MIKQKILLFAVGISFILFILVGCSGSSVESTLLPSLTSFPSSTTLPSKPTSIPPTDTHPPPTQTPIPATTTNTKIPPTFTVTPTENPAVIIQLEPGKFGHPLWLVVIAGNYQLVSGTTLRAGSSIGIAEEGLNFTPGLGINIEGGDIVLRGKPYSQGTKLIVNSEGYLIQR